MNLSTKLFGSPLLVQIFLKAQTQAPRVHAEKQAEKLQFWPSSKTIQPQCLLKNKKKKLKQSQSTKFLFYFSDKAIKTLTT